MMDTFNIDGPQTINFLSGIAHLRLIDLIIPENVCLSLENRHKLLDCRCYRWILLFSVSINEPAVNWRKIRIGLLLLLAVVIV
jgi:hypothetical protein